MFVRHDYGGLAVAKLFHDVFQRGSVGRQVYDLVLNALAVERAIGSGALNALPSGTSWAPS
jgi:hypothetical protein